MSREKIKSSMPAISFKLSSRKWMALAIILLTVVMQSLQYVWYLIIIDPLPNLGRLFANRFVLVASNLIQVSCMGLCSLSALSKHWPAWFSAILAWLLILLTITSVVVDCSYSGIASFETYVTKEVFWPQFNQTVLITGDEKSYQTVSIIYFALQALVYDIAQVAIVLWVYRAQLKWFWTRTKSDVGQYTIRIPDEAVSKESSKKEILAMLEDAATSPQDKKTVITKNK